MVVTENSGTQLELRKVLKTGGFSKITYISSGVLAMKLCEEQSYELAIVDECSEQIPGWSLIKELKNNPRIQNMPIIFLTSSKSQKIPDNLLHEYGILGEVSLPISQKHFMGILSKTIYETQTDGTVENKFTKAKNAFVNNDFVTAISTYEDLNKNLRGERATVGLVNSYDASNSPEKAQENMNELLKIDSSNPSYLILQARSKIKSGDKATAIQALSKVIENKKKTAFHSLSVCRISLEIENAELLLECCNDALKCNFELLEFYTGLASAFIMKKQYQDATKILLKAERKFGISADIENIRGSCYYSQSEPEKAIPHFHKALEFLPMNARIYFNLALCHYALREYDKAESFLELCLKITPTFERAREFRDIVHLATKEKKAV